MKAIVNYISLSLIFMGFSCESNLKNESTMKDTIEVKVDSLLSLMTLEEKIGQMSQVRHFYDIEEKDVAEKLIGSIIHTDGPTPGKTAEEWQEKFIRLQKQALSTRLGIPLLFGVDAIHGQNTYDGATIFPHNIGLGATYNPELVEEIAAITAIESQATGFNWVFSPCIAIPYNEKWGRVYEAFSESTEWTSKFARASVRGHQGNLSDRTTVMATAKHFIGDGATDYGVEGGKTSMSISKVKELLLPPYQAAVAEGVGSVMVGFNSFSGIPMHAHKNLVTNLLKDQMKFDGIVVSDWMGFSKYGRNKIINAGVDMVMAVDGDLDVFQRSVKRGVQTDTIAMDRVDDAVRRILRQKFRLGLFENPFPDPELISKIGSKSHRDKARQAVRESLVLLKNKNNVLPIDKNKTILVVGEHANSTGLQSGGWTISWQGSKENYSGGTTILEGIQKLSEGKVIYDKDGIRENIKADVAVLVVGEQPYAEFFGDIGHSSNKLSLRLSMDQRKLVRKYSEKNIPVVVVLISGRPLLVTSQIKQSDAFVAAWLPGSEGLGIAEVLFGDHNFTGKLPHSWPKSITNYKDKYGPNYWDASNEPLFKMGFGLTYE